MEFKAPRLVVNARYDEVRNFETQVTKTEAFIDRNCPVCEGADQNL